METVSISLRRHPRHRELWLSDDGRVFRELVPSVDGAGYAQIRNGKFRERRHALVCETWHGPRPAGCGVRHLDGDPSNDSPANLAWGTQKENAADTKRHGRLPVGEGHPLHKLTEAEALEIKRRRTAGESGKALSEEFGITQMSVCDLYKGRTWAWLKV